ncbi:hypothetical protein SAMN05519103_02589 [Rhizobiales bacterium GAS113]|nr:hypothetical protein SAMN05519103_02589 [Rhizobiales bacterium GAS113]
MTNGNLIDSGEDAAGRSAWANSSIGNDPDLTVEALQSGLTVSLIATKRADFETCIRDEEILTVVNRNRRNRFDFLPVIGATKDRAEVRSKIVGLIEIAPLMQSATSDERVFARMRPLSEENLIGADASILAFVRDADRQKCRLVVSGHEISGLVSLSDLQRLPVRAALFGLVTHLEIIMADAIRREFDSTDGWIERLSEGRKAQLQDEIGKATVGDGLVDELLFTQFADKMTIIHRSPYFTFGKNSFKGDLKQVQALRDHLAHANDYAASPRAACEVCSTVRLIDKWNRMLSNWPRSADPSTKE